MESTKPTDLAAGKNIIAADLADQFLHESGLVSAKQLKVRHWRSEFYLYNGQCYDQHSRNSLINRVVRWAQANQSLRKHAKTTTINNVLLNLEAAVKLDDEIRLQTDLAASDEYSPHLINVRNGIVDVRKAMQRDGAALRSHSSDFFSTACLPYNFDADAACPSFIRFLEKMQPDPQVRSFLQEWYGYNLVFDTRQAKFVLFVGEGANGKSVICVVLRTLLGEHNVCAVGLESFNPTRTFLLASTVGKLANIVEELNEVDRSCEGELKKFVSGGLMTAERKHRDPFEFQPSARCTFASNILPRFGDRSDGLWRRLILVPFDVQILSESEQDKRLIDPLYWIESEELPGIFNWALEGLARLNQRGHFDEPQTCQQAKERFKRDANPAKTYLLEHCEYKMGAEVSSLALYQAYSAYTKGNGQHPLGNSEFGREVGRVYPNAVKSDYAVRLKLGVRSHVWYNIELIS